jgi:hypothetical protein
MSTHSTADAIDILMPIFREQNYLMERHNKLIDEQNKLLTQILGQMKVNR